MNAPQQIADLVERFRFNIDAYRSGKYNETQVRHEFIDPFFVALGWDVNNERGYAEAYKDVIHEDALKIGGSPKAPDYSFRIGGVRKFFVEAKKPVVNIREDVAASFQVRRYAWSAKLPLSILTDFEEFAVYDCRVKPEKHDKASVARVKYFRFDEYMDHWEEIANIFSREAINKGSFDKYVQSAKKGTAEVDAAFLKEIESWREMLASNIASRNPGLSWRELNTAVQLTIDRIIFLRICEDRGLETYGQLRDLSKGKAAYERLLQIYRLADDRYNSGLFHFQKEKGQSESPDTLTPTLKIDDKTLKDILGRLYYPDSPYEFSVLPADILGQVYEQFLGKIIRLTSSRKAIVEDKPEVKKAHGVYYTPTYIVDYIVQNTIRPLVEGKTPGRIANLSILDPACGSGAFLIGAYQYLLNWYLDWYINNNPEKRMKGKNAVLCETKLGYQLTIGERKRILLDHIYGVDIDPQAVEVTKLSLLLRVLEGETAQVLNAQLKLFQERALPDLGNNIKCGNSLIGPDYYDDKTIFDIDEQQRINAFNWKYEYRSIIGHGGFDAVIGNPPYVRQEMLGDDKLYFQKNYEVYHGVADLYTYFIERGMSLLKHGGQFGIIVANKWMRANYGRPLRRWIKKICIEEIIDFGELPVFKQAITYPCILRMKQDGASPTFRVTQVKTLDFTCLTDYVMEHQYNVSLDDLPDDGWSLVDRESTDLLRKIHLRGKPLCEYVEGKIYYGIKTGLNEAFVIDQAMKESLIAQDPECADLIQPFLSGRDVKRYKPLWKDKYLILIPKGWTKSHCDSEDGWKWFCQNYPSLAKYLSPFADKANKRFDKGDFWWELRKCEYYDKFRKSKIIIPTIVSRASCMIDDNGFYSNDKTSFIVTSERYLLGILNSKLMDFMMHSISSTKQGGFYEYKPMYLQRLPIRVIDPTNSDDQARYHSIVALVEQMMSLHTKLAKVKTAYETTAIQRQIDTTDKQINELVYALYMLTEEDIRIIEENATH